MKNTHPEMNIWSFRKETKPSNIRKSVYHTNESLCSRHFLQSSRSNFESIETKKIPIGHHHNGPMEIKFKVVKIKRTKLFSS